MNLNESNSAESNTEKINPYLPPQPVQTETGSEEVLQANYVSYPGINRLGFNLISGFLQYFVYMSFIIPVLLLWTTNLLAMGVLLILAHIPQVWLCYHRLKNIGMNPQLGYFAIVPLLNFPLLFCCAVRQEGYVEVAELDQRGRSLAYVLIILVVVGLLAFGLSMINEPFRKYLIQVST